MPGINPLSRRHFIASAASLATFPLATVRSQTPKGTPMTTLTPYLLFDGSCLEAMEFYHSIFGGKLSILKVSESPMKDHMPAFQQNKVLNAHLDCAAIQISASDWLMPSATPMRGNTVCLYLSGGSYPQLNALFDKLSDGAAITDPLKEMFFGAYGALNDKYGNRWMFHSDAHAA